MLLQALAYARGRKAELRIGAKGRDLLPGERGRDARDVEAPDRVGRHSVARREVLRVVDEDQAGPGVLRHGRGEDGRVFPCEVLREALGERTITLDCDVLQADGGTRTAAITGAYVALVDAVSTLRKKGAIKRDPVLGAVAAVSVGICNGVPVLDLDYAEDSSCDTDMNVVMNDGGSFIEIQGTAEGHAFRREELDALLALAGKGVAELCAMQQEALAQPR